MSETNESKPERVVTTANESGQPEQTDNSARPEDGPQNDVPQTTEPLPGLGEAP